MYHHTSNVLFSPRLTQRLLLIAVLGVFAIGSSISVHTVRAATNTLTVTVFQDIDVDTKLDGGSDTLLAGITINVFDADDPTNTPCATAVTDGAGVATFAPGDTATCSGDQLRVEVDTTTYPVGTQVGPVNLTDDDADATTPADMDAADDASATVQIVDLSAGDVAFNVAVVDPSTYVCDASNATAMTTCFVDGDPLPEGSVSGPMDAIVAFPYTASGAAFPGTAMTYVEPDHISTNAEVGSVWGLAWSQQTEKVYTAAFLKRHVGLGPLGLDGIYVVDFSTGTPVTGGFVEVEDDLGIDVGQASVGSNTDRGLSSSDAESYDVDAWAQVATLGLGDVDVIDDEALDPTVDGWIDREFLLVTDLKNKDVLVIDTTDGSLVLTYDIPAPTPACTNGEHRPWAVNYVNGTMQIGLVCDGSTDVTNLDNNTPNAVLEAIVYNYDLTADLGAATIPGAPTVTPTVAIRYGLDYTKQTAWPGGCDASSNWHPWRDDLPPSAAPNTQFCWATPVLADIDFTDDGNMLMSFMDRFSHQIGWRNLAPDITDTVGGYRGNSAGDLLMACPDGGGGWDLESNGVCGALTTATTGGIGPGGGEFFGQDNWGTAHPEVVNAGVAVLPGSNEAIVAGMDPYSNLYHSAGGINWFNTQDGTARDPGYMLYASSGSNSPVTQGGTQGKSGGLGDVDLMCPQMPVQIGDYVWYDADQDGVQDPDEIPMPGTTVYLILESGAFITTTTDSNGHYYFDVSRNQSYTLAFDISTTTATLPPGVTIADLEPTTSDSASSTDINDSDLQGTVDVDGKTLPRIDYTTNIAGASDHTLDAGFTDPSYDLALVKTMTSTVPTQIGDEVVYNIAVMNQGDSPSGEFTVYDALPQGLVYVASSATTGTDVGTDVDITVDEASVTTDPTAPGSITWTLGTTHSLESGESITLEIRATLQSYEYSPLRNEAEIASDSGDDIDSFPDTDLANDSDNDTDTGNDGDETRDYTDLADVANTDVNADDEDDHDPAEFVLGTYDLALVKVQTGAAPTGLGDTVTFQITVQNQGQLGSGEFTVVDTLPPGLVYVSSSATSGTDATTNVDIAIDESSATTDVTAPGTLTWTLGATHELAPGEDLVLEYQTTLESYDYQTMRNEAEIASDSGPDTDSYPDTDLENDSDNDSDTGNDTDETRDYTDPADIDNTDTNADDEDDHDPAVLTLGTYDLALVKVITGAAPVQLGDAVTFEITVQNQGQIGSGEFTVFDALPPGLVYVTGSATNGTDATTSVDIAIDEASATTDVTAPGSITWTLGATHELAVGESLTLSYQATLESYEYQTMRNEAEIASDSGLDTDSYPDTDLANDSDNDSDTGNDADETRDYTDPTDISNTDTNADDEDDHDPAVLTIGDYDLALVKVISGATPVDLGETVTFEITVQNQGDVGSGEFTVYDALPPGLIYVSGSATTGTDATTDVDIAIDDSATTGDVAAPGSLTWTLSATHELLPGETLTLSYQAELLSYDYPSFRNEAEISTDSGPDIDSTPDTNMANDSDNDADNTNDGNETRDYTDPTDISNTDVNADDEDDHDPAEFPLGDYDLALVKVNTSDTAPTALGDTLTFEITVQNQGDLGSSRFLVYDELPAGLVYVTGSATAGTDAGTDVDIAIDESSTTTDVTAPGSLTWTLGATHSLMAGETLTLSYDVTLESYDYQVMRNEAEIADDSGGDVDSYPDTNLANDNDNDTDNTNDANETRDYTDPADIDNTDDNADDEDDHDPEQVVLGDYDLALVKVITGDAPTAVDDTVEYSIVIRNQGDLASSTFTVTDTIPAGMIYVTGSATSGTDADTDVDISIDESAATTDETAPGNITWTLGQTHSLLADEEIVLTYELQIKDLSLQTYRNEAEISSDSGIDVDSFPDTDTSNDSDNDDDATNDSDETRDYESLTNVVDTDSNSDDEDDHDPAVLTLPYDLALVKTITEVPIEAGGIVEYQIRVMNQGIVPSGEFTVIDVLPTGLVYVAGSATTGTDADTDVDISIDESAATTDAAAPGTVTWTLGATHSLEAGETVTLTIQATLEDVSIETFRNEAEITSDSGIELDSTPDANMENDSDNDADTSNDSDETRDYTDLADIANTDANADDEDDHDPASFSIGFDLALRKTLVTTEVVEPGDNVVFAITVFNQGNIAAYAIEVAEYTPTDMSYVSSNVTAVTSTANDNAVAISEAGAGANNSQLFNIDTLAAGDSVTFEVTMKIDDDFQGNTITNFAEISDADGDEDPDNDPPTDNDSDPDDDPDNDGDPENDEIEEDRKDDPEQDEDDHDPEVVTVGQTYDLALIKTLAAGQSEYVAVDDVIDYVLTVTNQGTLNSGAFTVTEHIPSGMEFVSATGTDFTCTQDGSMVDCVYGANLTPGNTVTIAVQLRVTDLTQNLANVAEISEDSGNDIDSDPDDDPSNDPTVEHDDIDHDDPDYDERTEDEDDHDQEVVIPVASIGDVVWYDNNYNGLQDNGEPGVENVTVNLYDENDNLIATTTTNADGFYEFTGLVPGPYYVQFDLNTLPTNYTVTQQDAGSDDALDSDADPSTGRAPLTTLDPGEHDPTWDMGIYQPAGLGDYVWLDVDGDGIQDDNEDPVENVTVNLLDQNGNIIGTTTTDSNGYYEFRNLLPGNYIVEFIKPEGFGFTFFEEGLDASTDSNADRTTGRTPLVSLSAGEFDPTIDAGLATGSVLSAIETEIIRRNTPPTPTPTPQPPAAQAANIQPPTIVKSEDRTIGTVGDQVTYTLVVTNPNATTITGVTVTDTLDSRLDYVSSSSQQGGASYDPASRTVSVAVGDMTANQSVTITIVARLNATAQAPNVINNVAQVIASGTSSIDSNTVSLQIIPNQIPTTGEFGAGNPWSMVVYAAIGLLLALNGASVMSQRRLHR